MCDEHNQPPRYKNLSAVRDLPSKQRRASERASVEDLVYDERRADRSSSIAAADALTAAELALINDAFRDLEGRRVVLERMVRCGCMGW